MSLSIIADVFFFISPSKYGDGGGSGCCFQNLNSVWEGGMSKL